MEHYTQLKYLHLIPALLVLGGIFAHTLMLWLARRSGDVERQQRKLRSTRCYSLPAMLLVTLSLPVSGWWLAHIAGWPLGQLWLLWSSGLFALLVLAALLLQGRLGAWQRALASDQPATGAVRWSLACALLIALLFLAIFGLMG
ncbi:TPA: DUF2269 family protein, partial [Klebsiella pneumoniae]